MSGRDGVSPTPCCPLCCLLVPLARYLICCPCRAATAPCPLAPQEAEHDALGEFVFGWAASVLAGHD